MAPRATATDLLIVAPLAALALYVLIFLIRWSAIVTALYLNADIASGPVIAQSLASAPGHAEILLGNYPWFEALGLMSILRMLPEHRFLWEVVPFALTVVAVSLVALGTQRAAGRRAAMLTLAIGLVASPATVPDLGTWTVHGLTWVHAALLGWLAVWLIRARTRRSALTVAGAVGLISGPALASDVLLIPGGLLPLWMAALAVGLRGRAAGLRTNRRTLLEATLLTTALAMIAAVATVLLAHSKNIRGAGSLPIDATSIDRLPHNLQVLWESLAALGNGDVFNAAFGGSTLIHAVCAGLTIIAMVVALGAVWSALTGAASASTVAHAAFWGTAVIGLLLAFVLTTVPIAAFSGRYLVGVLLAVAALVPLAPHRLLGRVVTSTSITFYVLAGVMSLLRGEMTTNYARFPTPAQANEVARFVSAHGAGVGYAGYWDAAPLMWASHFAIHVYPVSACGDRLCAFQFHRVGAWYDPRDGRRSYLVLDTAVRLGGLRGVPPALGKPVAAANLGSLVVYIFDYDIAHDFGVPLRGPQS